MSNYFASGQIRTDDVERYLFLAVVAILFREGKLAFVLPAKNDSYVMFYLQSYQGLRIKRYCLWVFCAMSLFCYVVCLCLSSFAIILPRKTAGCFT